MKHTCLIGVWDGGGEYPVAEIWPKRVMANTAHGDFEICQALTRVHPLLPYTTDNLGTEAPVILVWPDNIVVNEDHDIVAISMSMAYAEPAGKQLAAYFLEEQDGPVIQRRPLTYQTF